MAASFTLQPEACKTEPNLGHLEEMDRVRILLVTVNYNR